MSKYQDIASKLIAQLDKGVLNPGDRFYTEAEISKIYHVSSTTAVKVLNTLQELNRVTRVQGSGTYVAKEAHHRMAMLTDLNLAGSQSESVRVLSAKLANDQAIISKLHLQKQQYLEVRRLRYIGQKISQYAISYLNPAWINVADLDDLTSFNSIYQKIQMTSGLNPYELPFKQKNWAQVVQDDEILRHFTANNSNQIFICQERQTYLPFIDRELLEYAISYKLPEYWGYEADATVYRL